MATIHDSEKHPAHTHVTGMGAMEPSKPGLRDRAGDVADSLRESASDVGASTRDPLEDLGPRLSAMSETGGRAIQEVDRALRSSPDETIGLVGGISIGTAVGLSIAGSSRIMVIMALVPAAFAAAAVLGRGRDRGIRRSASSG